MHSMRSLAVAVLAVVLALSAVQNAFASQWIIYDNDHALAELLQFVVGVRFSLPAGVPTAHLVTVSFYWILPQVSIQGSGMLMSIRPSQPFPQVIVHVTGSPPGTDLITPVSIMGPIPGGWNTVDVSGSNLVVSGDFFVVIEQAIIATVGYDDAASNFEGRSVYGDSVAGVTANSCCGPGGSHNLMIRAEIDPTAYGAPVGGFVESVNKLTVLAPWFAVIGLVGCVGTIVVVAKKRR